MSVTIIGRAARTGVQRYPEGDEHRDASEVFDPRSLASWVGAPVTIGHPGTVDASNVRSVAIGYVKSVARDGDHVLATMIVHNDSAIARVKSGELVELSAGYCCVLDGSKNQRDIKINHLALLPEGSARCGASCSLV